LCCGAILQCETEGYRKIAAARAIVALEKREQC
jgi:hypothetical protein